MPDLSSYQHIYFVGIGGIGMSALARYFRSRNVKVSGYDLTRTKLTDALSEAGCNIHYDENVSLIPDDIDLVVYTPAIPNDHKELSFLKRENKVVILKRSQVLGLLSEEKECIAVAGTHGKTSTSAVVAHLLHEAGLSPTAFVGGIMKNYNSNYIEGSSNWIIAEADEFDRSFLHLYPRILIIQSLDADHLDIYKDYQSLINAYERLTEQVKPKGYIILQNGLIDKFSDTWREKMKSQQINIIEFESQFGPKINKVEVKDHRFVFDLQLFDHYYADIPCEMPGLHNVKNKASAIVACLKTGLSIEDLLKGIVSFKGIKRRFEKVFDNGKCVLIDDYAHHPTELKAAISTARKLYPNRKITGIFQPHLYSRTQDFYREFAHELDQLDELILLPIYPARELPIEGVSSSMILDIMKNNNGYLLEVQYLIPKLHDISPDVLLTLGASDIDKYHDEIIQVLNK